MREYSPIISLVKNSRGVYCLDTSIGCSSGLKNDPKGCYNDCYAAKSAKMYGYDFNKTVFRSFKNEHHRREIVAAISRIELPFVRIGCSGDPSENWEHTCNILDAIKYCNKEIVIITKHWTKLTDEQLEFISTINLCVNTSVSALDAHDLLAQSLYEYHRLKPFCKSVLRIVSADFNLENETGKRLSILQDSLFQNDGVIDTVLRVGKSNPFAKEGIINLKRGNFMGKNCSMSKRNKKTYVGKCGSCLEMCGATMKPESHTNKSGIPLIKQTSLF